MNENEKKPYYSANDFFKEKFGCKIIKIPLDGGFTCPNRDGTLDTKGCIFCSGNGSGDFAGNRNQPLSEQFNSVKNKLNKKWKKGKYIVYFQAFTNTYASTEKLEKMYREVLSFEDVVGISIATRPDCLDIEKINLLKELSKETYITVELGLQTVKTESIRFINRRYENSVYENAVCMLKGAGIDVITHIIIGLPNESENDIINTVEFSVKCGTNGVKLQLLHVLEGTRLGELYKENPFEILTLDKYCNLICNIIKKLPKNIVIHRITGDGPKKILIEPKWSADKKRVLNSLNLAIKDNLS